MKQVTNYFRNAIAASTNGPIDYKKETFYTLTAGEVELGQLGSDSMAFLRTTGQDEEVDVQEDDSNRKTKQAIIALKTVSTKFVASKKTETDLEEMTSILFLPVKVSRQGRLYPAEDGKIPWIPREYLKPMEEPVLAIGDAAVYDAFFEETTDERNQICSWKTYLNYAKHLYEFVTKARFDQQVLLCGEEIVKTDGKYYLFEDRTINTTFHILQLYNHLLKSKENKLYSKLTSGEAEKSKKLYKNSDTAKMKKHKGQMGGEYPLSPSQREVINHFDEIGEGEILAVNGPPGTGKTTLLQSVVANMYVNSALKEEAAPIIVAASTNNQAVTNIIDSFGKINSIREDNLEKRWISGINSFAVYFPAKSKTAEAKRKRYQYTNVLGEAFAEDIETEENRDKSKDVFYSEYAAFFGSPERDLLKCRDALSAQLNWLDTARINCISAIEKIASILDGISYKDYIDKLVVQLTSYKEEEYRIKQEISDIKIRTKEFLDRRLKWRESYQLLPWYIRLFKFLPPFKRKLLSWSYAFMNDDELEFLKRDMTIEEVEAAYLKKVDDNDEQLRILQNKKNTIKGNRTRQEKKIKRIESSLNSLKRKTDQLSGYIELPKNMEDLWAKFDACKINDLLDQIRYVEFWFAVHYYECRWLMEDNPISEKQKKTTFENVLNNRYRRMAMLAPCMVMTFFMMPKQFLAYDGNDKKHFYMYDYIDLLIVDEAGQISPEIAAASFSLAKRAVVVGDEQQIPPVWGTIRALDIAMAIESGMIGDRCQYPLIENNGLNCSQSSLMKLASQSCAFGKYGKGLFLSEHRRCYDEIISYCNELVYNGRLEPLRGTAQEDRENVLKAILPAMGHKEIKTAYSQRMGTSRQNLEEAKQIVQWIKANYLIICDLYKKQSIENQENFNPKQIMGIITPFKSQSNLIRRLMKREILKWNEDIEVGTVHTFQGAEKRVIIFSSVYGNQDGCYFINRNNSLMNVAVSRAKDSFLVFGDSGCLEGALKSAGNLLKKMTQSEVQ
ncbi:DEAD/DEAH box helicase [Anaerovorax odorimutans]|uniref:DEAD/DEAH box helicase n=1 Tax=Anaerovorax odorimutans TaxID=109327 RepID=A0ABT1RLP3_9FIRM|nr:AAA domain-containing protein [Anaerovorax odorimutans]MCQ4636103.1 DEAD/DEAH box helicase [Anaerovorax odorimutans]